MKSAGCGAYAEYGRIAFQFLIQLIFKCIDKVEQFQWEGLEDTYLSREGSIPEMGTKIPTLSGHGGVGNVQTGDPVKGDP